MDLCRNILRCPKDALAVKKPTMVLGHVRLSLGSSCSPDFVCAMDEQVDSRNRNPSDWGIGPRSHSRVCWIG